VVEFHSGVGAELLVFPESIIHGFADVDRVALIPALNTSGRPEVWIGATLRGDDGRVENALVRLDGSIVARNRLPVPIGNWRPFMDSGVVASPFGSDLVTLNGRSVAISICYEDAVLWPHPGLLMGQADALVSASNHWALRETRTARAQVVAAHALARIADVPLIRSANL
jgi:apolipoprotein N-acyltransferase